MAVYENIGPWSEIKLDIVREYASAYSRILSARRDPAFDHWYLDAFAGAGVHVSRTTQEFVTGSPLNALLVDPPFKRYHFIDMDSVKVESLRSIAGERPDVSVHEGDCNRILHEILPTVRFEDHRRALCLLDPYGLHLHWDVIRSAGQLRTVEIFLNFPIADMNRNVLHRDPQNVERSQIERMSAYWGDESWRDAAYRYDLDLFGDRIAEKQANDAVAGAFQQRLKSEAGFAHVSKPLPMRNSVGATV